MKALIKILIVVIMTSLVFSCKKDTRPNYQFMPNMYEPVGYETYGEYEVFPGQQSAMLPVEGTISCVFVTSFKFKLSELYASTNS